MKKLSSAIFLIFLIIFTIKSFESLLIYKHVDALNYHIVIAKYIVNGMWTKAWTQIPGSLMSGLFEYLYIIPHLIFNYGLKAQASSQLLHFLFSIGCGSLLLFSLFKKENFALACLAGISLLTISRGSSFFLYAKNDGVLALSYLATLIYFIRIKESQKTTISQSIIFGLLLGLNQIGRAHV